MVNIEVKCMFLLGFWFSKSNFARANSVPKSNFARANSVPKKYSQIYAITLLFTFMVNIEVKCMFLLGFVKIANRKSD